MKIVYQLLEKNGGRAADRTPDPYDVNVVPNVEQAESRGFCAALGAVSGDMFTTGSRFEVWV